MTATGAAPDPATGAAPDRGLRGNREFLLLWSGTGLSFLGSRLSAFAYPLIVLYVTGSPAAAGLVTFAAQLPYLVVQLHAGLAVDRFDRRRLLVFCDVGRLLAVGSIPIAMLVGGLNLWHLAAVAFVEGSFTVLYRITERAAVPSVVPERHLTTAMSRNEAREQAAGLLGQPGAGLLTAVAQWFPFVATAVLHLLSLCTVLLIRKKLQSDVPERTQPQRPLAALTEGLRWMAGHRFARAAAGLIAVSNLLFQVLVLTVLVIVRDDGGSQAVAGLVAAVSGVGGLTGALSATIWIRRISLPALVIGANALWALLVPMTLFAGDPVLLGVLFGVMAYIGAVWTVGVSAYLVGIVPDHLRGRVVSVATLLAYGPLAFGSLLGGFGLATLGVTGTILAVAGVMAALTVLAAASPGVRSLSR